MSYQLKTALKQYEVDYTEALKTAWMYVGIKNDLKKELQLFQIEKTVEKAHTRLMKYKSPSLDLIREFRLLTAKAIEDIKKW